MRDLEAVGDHIARDKPAAAARLVARIFAEIDRLADFPYSGAPAA